MDNQKWEVVSYGKNKKGGGQKLSKAEKKKRAGTMPTIDPNGMSLGFHLMMIERLLQSLLFRLSFQCQDGIRPKRGRNFQWGIWWLFPSWNCYEQEDIESITDKAEKVCCTETKGIEA